MSNPIPMKRGFHFFVVSACALLAGCSWSWRAGDRSTEGRAMAQQDTEQPASDAVLVDDWADNPLNMIDATVRFADADAWAQGTHDRTATDAQGRLTIDAPPKQFPAGGAWTSPVVEAEFPFTEVLPSFNLDAPADTGARLLVRVRHGGDDWSPWLDLDGWGELRGTGRGSEITYEHGTVEIDWIELSQPAHAIQLKLELVSFDAAEASERRQPAVSKVVAVYSGNVGTETLVAQADHTNERGDALATLPRIDLSVPMLRQGKNGPALAPRTCSPTSVTMVMAFHGVALDPRGVSEAIYDRRYHLFGNWAKAVAFASTHGLDAELKRFRNWDDLRDTLEAGAPVIASIRFEEGEFPSNRMKRTNGHLIVIRGVTEDGDAIVNDPAYDEGGEGVVYKQQELARAWLAKGGVGYVITPGATRH